MIPVWENTICPVCYESHGYFPATRNQFVKETFAANHPENICSKKIKNVKIFMEILGKYFLIGMCAGEA
jgi:hypothetical protein